jgi:hypothetical protein
LNENEISNKKGNARLYVSLYAMMMKGHLGEVEFQKNLKDSLFNPIQLSFLINAPSLL